MLKMSSACAVSIVTFISVHVLQFDMVEFSAS